MESNFEAQMRDLVEFMKKVELCLFKMRGRKIRLCGSWSRWEYGIEDIKYDRKRDIFSIKYV